MKLKWLGVVIVIFVLAILLLTIGTLIEMDNQYETGIVTDKWSGSVVGKMIYRFEIDNTTIVNVPELDYYNFEIGDSYTYALIDVE